MRMERGGVGPLCRPLPRWTGQEEASKSELTLIAHSWPRDEASQHPNRQVGVGPSGVPWAPPTQGGPLGRHTGGMPQSPASGLSDSPTLDSSTL